MYPDFDLYPAVAAEGCDGLPAKELPVQLETVYPTVRPCMCLTSFPVCVASVDDICADSTGYPDVEPYPPVLVAPAREQSLSEDENWRVPRSLKLPASYPTIDICKCLPEKTFR